MNNKTIEKNADPAFIGQAQNDVQKLVERMKQTPCGEIAGYRELSQLIGRDVTVHRHLVDSARRILLRVDNMVFRCVMNEGYKRLEDAQVVDVVSVDRRKRARRQMKLAVRELSTVDYDKLPPPQQTKHNVGMAMFGVMLQASSASSMKKLQEKVANAGGKIDVDGTLKLVGWL